MLDVDGWSKRSNSNYVLTIVVLKASVEHVVEVTAKRRLLCHVSHTGIHTKNGIVWTAARHRAECHPYLKKSKSIVVGGWLYDTCKVCAINEDETTKNEEKKNHKIIVHGWLSATLGLLLYACLLALSHSGRHIRTTVCACCCCHHGVAVLRLVVVLLLLLPL